MTWKVGRFELLYDSYIRRTVIDELRQEQRAQIRAIMANAGYFNSKDAMQARKDEIEKLNEHFEDAIAKVDDPDKERREQEAFEQNPLFAAGLRGLDRLRWEFGGVGAVRDPVQYDHLVQ